MMVLDKKTDLIAIVESSGDIQLELAGAQLRHFFDFQLAYRHLFLHTISVPALNLQKK
jgi:hypothetical protein